jgi:flagellin
MALSIATNTAALQASAAASSVNRDLETSMARLSTGKRINSASDDAAGVAIASRLTAEIRGTDQAIRNALDGQALIDTAEGGHKEIEAILQRMREVSIQAASDTNNAQDRGNLQAEVKALITEIDRIAGVTTWAGNSVMDGGSGSSKTFSLQVGAATGTKNQIDVAINDMGKAALGIARSGDYWESTVSALTVGGNTAYVSLDTATGVLNLHRVSGNYKAEIEGQAIALANGAVREFGNGLAADFAAQINANATLKAKGIKAVALADVATVNADNRGAANTAGYAPGQIVFDTSADASAASWILTGTNADGNTITETVTGSGTGTFTSTSTNTYVTVTSITQAGTATNLTIGTLSTGGSHGAGWENSILGSTGNTTAGNLLMTGKSATSRIEILHGADDMSSSSKAMHAVTVIDAAIKTVNTQRSELGAISNRLSHTVSNMTNISTNLSAARGGIEDADFAVETTNLAKNQILQQASTAMLAQANASKQNVLSLLQG